MANEAAKGLTPKAAHDAMVAEMEQLFDGMTFTGRKGEQVPLNIYGQFFPIQSAHDNIALNDLQRLKELAPSLQVRIEGGAVKAPHAQQQVTFIITACAFDRGKERDGITEVYIITQEIMNHFMEDPYFGSMFETQFPMDWAIQQEETAPFYYGAVSIPVALPVAVVRSSRNKTMEDLL